MKDASVQKYQSIIYYADDTVIKNKTELTKMCSSIKRKSFFGARVQGEH